MSEFVPVRGYEEYYKINAEGEVLSSFYGIILKHGNAAGYPRVVLYRPGKGGKSYHIHRLLAEHFIPNPLEFPQVNHIDGNRENFGLDNLEWCTASYNVKDGYSRGRDNGWGTTRPLIDRTKTCEHCRQSFQRKKPQQRFCNNTCAALGSIELFKQGVLPGKE